jgi:hypothetical protein
MKKKWKKIVAKRKVQDRSAGRKTKKNEKNK